VAARSKEAAIRKGREYLKREREKALKRFDAFRAKALANPISTFDLQYSSADDQFTSETARLSSGDLEFSFTIEPAGSVEGGEFAPETAHQGSLRVTPKGFSLSSFGIVLALEVSNNDPEWRPKLNWHRKTDPSMSAAYIVDTVNQSYIYLSDSSLKGEVVAGTPKTGLLVFEPFRQATSKLELHISDIQCGPNRGQRATFVFRLESEGIHESSRTLVEAPPLEEQFERTLNETLDKLWAKSSPTPSGCVVVLGSALLASGLVGIAGLMVAG
jgi:hypothetical protein